LNITIHPFKFKHLKQLHEILTTNDYEGLTHIDMSTLPRTGYIILSGDTPIAAGFLRRLEPCFCQIDTLCTNKYMGAIIRNQAINMIVSTLIDEAKRMKLKGIVAHSSNQSVLNRAKELGFHTIEEKIIALPLSDRG
jgi:hypothetical protein